MNLKFECPYCGKSLAVDEEWLYTEVECPSCGNSVVPDKAIKSEEAKQAKQKEEEMLKRDEDERRKEMRVCSNCGAQLDGGITKCPKCEKSVCINCGNILGHMVSACPKCGQVTATGAVEGCGGVLRWLGCLLMLALGLFFLFSILSAMGK